MRASVEDGCVVLRVPMDEVSNTILDLVKLCETSPENSVKQTPLHAELCGAIKQFNGDTNLTQCRLNVSHVGPHYGLGPAWDFIMNQPYNRIHRWS